MPGDEPPGGLPVSQDSSQVALRPLENTSLWRPALLPGAPRSACCMLRRQRLYQQQQQQQQQHFPAAFSSWPPAPFSISEQGSNAPASLLPFSLGSPPSLPPRGTAPCAADGLQPPPPPPPPPPTLTPAPLLQAALPRPARRVALHRDG